MVIYFKVRIEIENIQSKLKGRINKDKMRENRLNMVWSCKNMRPIDVTMRRIDCLRV